MWFKHTENASIRKLDLGKMLEVPYDFVQLYEKKMLHMFIAAGTH